MEKSEGLSLIWGACALPSAIVLQLNVDKDPYTEKETEREEGSSFFILAFPPPDICVWAAVMLATHPVFVLQPHHRPVTTHEVVPLSVCPSGFVSHRYLRYICALLYEWK